MPGLFRVPSRASAEAWGLKLARFGSKLCHTSRLRNKRPSRSTHRLLDLQTSREARKTARPVSERTLVIWLSTTPWLLDRSNTRNICTDQTPNSPRVAAFPELRSNLAFHTQMKAATASRARTTAFWPAGEALFLLASVKKSCG